MSVITLETVMELHRRGAARPVRAGAVGRLLGDMHRGKAEADSRILPWLAPWVRDVAAMEPADAAAVAGLRNALHDTLASFGLDPADWLANALGGADVFDAPAWRRRKLALLLPARHIVPEARASLSRADPLAAALGALSALADDRVHPVDDAALERLPGWLAAQADLALPAAALPLLAVSVFQAAYQRSPQRLAAKAWMHRQVRGVLDDLVPPAPVAVGRKPDVPLRVTVHGEHLVPGHAMLRCFGPLIAGLADRLDLSLVVPQGTRCAEHRALAGRIFYVKEGPGELTGTVAAVRASQPDILFLPSVGMSVPGLALANLRLARLQVAGIGHPAPVGSGFIDFLALQAAHVGAGSSFDEPLLPFGQNPLDTGIYRAASLARLLAREPDHDPPTVGVPASRMKFDSRFLEVLAELRDRWHGARWRFLPGLRGTAHVAFARKLAAIMPGAEVVPGQDFEGYLESLASCRLLLQSFPFGGTNTTLDALMLGRPIVCMDGPELHSRMDAVVLEAAGQARWLARDVGDYLAKAALAWDAPCASMDERLSASRRAASAVAGPQPGRSLADAFDAAWGELTT